MDDQSRCPRSRPQIYLRLEFGVSWSPNHAPNNHEITYKSRRVRERLPYFPRRVPAPTTNFLSMAPAPRQQWDQAHPRYYEPQQQLQQAWDGVWREEPPPEERRRSRAESVSSHERRRSAPPPIGTNPWDVNVWHPIDAGLPSTSTVAAATTALPPPELSKALPEVPSRFRLGEDGMPWTPWVYPMGHEPVAYPQEDDAGSTHSRAANAAADAPTEAHTPSQPHTATVSPLSPGDSRGPHHRRHRRPPSDDPERVRQLGALSAAMMTVDNGFENQWWNQGPRESTSPTADLATEPPPPPPPPPPPEPQSRLSLGWAVASSTPGSRDDRLTFAMADTVSPLSASDCSTPGGVPPFQSLTRTLSTRSAELFLH